MIPKLRPIPEMDDTLADTGTFYNFADILY